MEGANKGHETRKFYTIACGMKANFQPRTSICTDGDNSLIGNDRMIMERWKQYFYETRNIEDDMEIREEVIHQGPEEQIETPTKDEVWEIIRTLNNSLSP